MLHSLRNDPNYRGRFIDVAPAIELECEVVCEEGLGGTRTSDFSLSLDSGDEPMPVASDGSSISGRTESTTVSGAAQYNEVRSWVLLVADP